MLKRIFPHLGLAAMMLMMAGCTSTSSGGGIETKAYIADKDRVDQNMEGGNYGYIMGTPKAPDRSHLSKTRKIYTLEITKNPDVTPEELRKPVPPAAPVKINIPESPAPAYQEPEAAYEPPVYIPPVIESNVDTESHESSEMTGEMKEYVVESGDTLQKISKKFYGSYSKWNRIYEANKDIIANPNKIKKGLTIRIPQ